MATTITVVCPHCNTRVRASSEHVGRKGSCPNCRELVQIVSGDAFRPAAQPTEAARRRREADARLSSTNVSIWAAGLIGAAAAAAVYLALLLTLRDTYLGHLFLDRSPVKFATTLVTCWGLAILALKYLAVKRQLGYADLELKLIPLEIGLQINSRNVDQFLEHFAGLGRDERLSILGRRIHGALEHFKSRNSVPEVQQYLTTQAELDASSVDSGYTLLRCFIFVVPLLGFIGTVMGISAAVTGMDDIIQGSGSEGLTTGLREVTAGLAVAFDTTFLALVMAILLLFPTEALRKTEYGILDRIEAFANESLLRRMADEPKPSRDGELPHAARQALEPVFREHQKWMAQWQVQVARLGQEVGEDFEKAVRRVEENLSCGEAARVKNMQELSRLWDELFRKAENTTGQWQESAEAVCLQSKDLHGVIGQLKQSLAESAKLLGEASEQQRRLAQRYAETDFAARLSELCRQIERLVDTLVPAAGPERGESTETIVPLQQEPAVAQTKDRRGLLRRMFRWLG